MPHRLKQRQHKIQEKRKQTPWREFVMEICSWFPVNVYKNQGLISRFPPSDRSGTMHTLEVFIDKYQNSGGVDIDDNASFLDQLAKFFSEAPMMALMKYGKNENVEYADTVYGANNCYMTFSVGNDSENIIYSCMVFEKCTNVLSSVMITSQTSDIYYSASVTVSSNIFYSRHIHNSSDIRFSSNLLGCRDCIFCEGLENKQYCIENIQYSKDEYIIKRAELLKQKNNFQNRYSDVDHIGQIKGSENVTGSAIVFSNNIENGYSLARVGHGRNVIGSDGTPYSEHQYDVLDAAQVNHAYAWMGVGQHSNHVYCGCNAATCTHVFYSYFMDACTYCLGCTGLVNKSYCIFNKQYTKEERYDKVDEIFTQMEAEGTLGSFPPGSMTPFYFNDTVAYLIDDSFTKEEVEAKGYLWRDEAISVDIPDGMEVVKTSELDRFEGWSLEDGTILTSSKSPPTPISQGGSENASWRIDPSILTKVIQDEQGNVYRIVKMEYDFLVKHGLPLPRLHRLDRLKMNFKITE